MLLPAAVRQATGAIYEAKVLRGGSVPTEAELVRQEGRDYEPASALPARIRADRAANDDKPAAGCKTGRGRQRAPAVRSR